MCLAASMGPQFRPLSCNGTDIDPIWAIRCERITSRSFVYLHVYECTCSAGMIARYQKRISGPLIDRIDIHVQVPRVDYEKLSSDRLGEPSSQVRQRFNGLGDRSRIGLSTQPGGGTHAIRANADIGPAEIRRFCRLDDAGNQLLKGATPALAAQVQVCARCSSRPGPITAFSSWRAR